MQGVLRPFEYSISNLHERNVLDRFWHPKHSVRINYMMCSVNGIVNENKNGRKKIPILYRPAYIY